MSNVLMDISLHADTQHRAVLSVYTRNYQHLKTYYIWSSLSVKCLEKIVGCYPQSDANDGTAQPDSVVLSVYTKNYQHLKTYYIWSNFSVKCLEKIVSCYPQSDASDGTAQPASLFLVLYLILCPQWSASKRYRRCSRGCRWLFTFLLCNQEHGVNNERSQSIQSVLHSKRTHRMWSHQKDRSKPKKKKRKKRKKFVSFA